MKTSKIIRDNHGKLDEPSNGVGEISNDMIRNRAAELATADGRKSNEFTDADYLHAKAELTGVLHADMDHPEEAINGVRLPEEAAATTGHRFPKRTSEDNFEEEETIGERLVEEGIEEAQHDEMVEAGKATLRDEDLER